MCWHVNTDGVLGGAGSKYADVFVKVNDDAIKMTAGAMDIKRVVAWQQADGSVVQLSWNLFEIISASTLDQLALIGADNTDIAYPTGSSPPLNSSIISLRNMMAGKLTNFSFKNIYADVKLHTFAIFQLEDDLVYLDQPRKTKKCFGPGDFTDDNPSHNQPGDPYLPQYFCQLLDGEGIVETLTFENVEIEDVPSPTSPVRFMIFDNRRNEPPGGFYFNNSRLPSFYQFPDCQRDHHDYLENLWMLSSST